MRLGLISDTHGLLRPQAVDALRQSGLIIHAGDVGHPGILESLKSLAPVIAVRGNIDQGPWAKSLPETVVAEPAGVPIYVIHNIRELKLDPAAAGFRIVISGHSHKPVTLERGGVLYINPGAAGPRRFKLPITVARLDLARTPWQPEFVHLEAV
jgi:putative phosphoesterase